jgi:hypothetical protein
VKNPNTNVRSLVSRNKREGEYWGVTWYHDRRGLKRHFRRGTTTHDGERYRRDFPYGGPEW